MCLALNSCSHAGLSSAKQTSKLADTGCSSHCCCCCCCYCCQATMLPTHMTNTKTASKNNTHTHAPNSAQTHLL
jgi:hypothetical protein